MALVRGDFASLERLQRQVDALAKQKLTAELAPRVGAAFMKELADEFRQSRDPYGNAWAPVFRNRRRDRLARGRRAAAGKAVRADKPLVDTGRLRASATAKADGTKVRIVLPVEYASYHQEGTRRIKRRQMLPEAATGGLGPRWTMAANKEAAVLLKKHFGK